MATKIVYYTRSPLSTGILKVRGVELANDPDEKFYAQITGWEIWAKGKGKEWHEDENSAIEYCENQRKKQITLLRKKIKVLQSLDFHKIHDKVLEVKDFV